MNDDFKLGFVMGIISGEGSFTGDYRKPALQVKMHARDITLLESLREMFGGNIYGPYTHSDRYYCLWILRGEELRQAAEVFLSHLPECHKRIQFMEWLRNYYKDLVPK
jgi:hypothetical protein